MFEGRAFAYGLFAGNTGRVAFVSGFTEFATGGAAGVEVSFAIRAELATCPERGTSGGGAVAARICVAGAAPAVGSGCGAAMVVRSGSVCGVAAAAWIGVAPAGLLVGMGLSFNMPELLSIDQD